MSSWQARSEIDRLDSALDDPAALAALWADPTAALIRFDENAQLEPSCLDDPDPPAGQLRDADLFLGQAQGRIWFARNVAHLHAPVGLRQIDVPAWQRQLLVRAQALFQWHAQSPVCEFCKGQTRHTPGGSSRTCTRCQQVSFPRTDPAVIVGILDAQDRLLLANNVAWPRERVSILAGFIEAGESAEQACHREIYEEAGVRLSALRFVGSQPWPFPRSLMLGFIARTADEVHVCHAELSWGKFFERTELREAVADRRIKLPGQGSIAARIIEEWLAGRLPAPES